MSNAGHTPPADVGMDGTLRRISDRTWEGWLRGYRAQVFELAGGWYLHVMHPRGHAITCRPVTSLADGAMVGRRLIEAQVAGQR